MSNKISWRRWDDPIARFIKNAEKIEPYRPEEDEHDPEYHESLVSFGVAYPSRLDDGGIEPNGTGPAIVGAMGIIPLHESNVPSKLFNFWVGDTNFDLDEVTVSKIEDVPGVEALDVFTRYRFRLAIGRSFNEQVVKQEIEAIVNPPAEAPEPSAPEPDNSPYATLKLALATQHPYWAIYVAEDESIEVAGGETQQDVEARGLRFSADAKQVIASWGELHPS